MSALEYGYILIFVVDRICIYNWVSINYKPHLIIHTASTNDDDCRRISTSASLNQLLTNPQAQNLSKFFMS